MGTTAFTLPHGVGEVAFVPTTSVIQANLVLLWAGTLGVAFIWRLSHEKMTPHLLLGELKNECIW